MLAELPTPCLLVDAARLDANIGGMQAACDAAGTQLWPHIKTHKSAEIARRQLAAGAVGLTCAKLGEAEAMLASGVRRMFVAYGLVDRRLASRLAALSEATDEVILACTSIAQTDALDVLLADAGLRAPVMMAVDSGLGREGARGPGQAVALAAHIRRSPRMDLAGIYTHEGHAYARGGPAELRATVRGVHARLAALRDAVDAELPLWPGCSVTAAAMAGLPGVAAVRPGTYVFGDLALTLVTQTAAWETLALSVLATVVDRPEPGLALLDAGTKTLGSDRTADGAIAAPLDGSGWSVTRCSEEHGFATGRGADALRVGERVRVVPAHVCPVVNLADELVVTDGSRAVDRWPVTARGRSR
ncbi:MAG: alanine racemase [Chthonomonadales bacterium]|nr:alanine racemase [Chthonomonadales bacterium]